MAGRNVQGSGVRTVKTVALFSGPVELGSDGEVSIPLHLPDFNGELRLMAIAWDKARVGMAEQALLVRDPLVARVVAPCAHSFECPLQDSNHRCNFAQRSELLLRNSKSWRDRNGVTEKYSYIVLQKTRASSAAASAAGGAAGAKARAKAVSMYDTEGHDRWYKSREEMEMELEQIEVLQAASLTQDGREFGGMYADDALVAASAAARAADFVDDDGAGLGGIGEEGRDVAGYRGGAVVDGGGGGNGEDHGLSNGYGAVGGNVGLWGRIHNTPIKKNKHVYIDLCTSEGTMERVAITKKKGGPLNYRTARKSQWGDVWPPKYTVDEYRKTLDSGHGMVVDDDGNMTPYDPDDVWGELPNEVRLLIDT